MSLQTNTIKRLFREIFFGDTPLTIALEEQEALEQLVETNISGFSNVKKKSSDYYHREADERHIMSFSIQEPSTHDYYWTNNYFDLIINEENRFLIKHYRDVSPIYNIRQILAFINACQEFMEKRQLKKTKQKKVREFQVQAIIAQIKKAAKEDQFDFSTKTDTRKLKLFVKISDTECIELHIPFKSFQAVLPGLRMTIRSLKDFWEQGIKFKPRSLSFCQRYTNWVFHKNL